MTCRHKHIRADQSVYQCLAQTDLYYCDFHVRLYNSNIKSKICVENDELPSYCKIKPGNKLKYEPTTGRQSLMDLEKMFFKRNF